MNFVKVEGNGFFEVRGGSLYIGGYPVLNPDNTPLSWTQLGTDILGDAENDQSGHSVSLSSDGSTVAIGAYLNDANGLYNSGQVRIFKYQTDSWTQLGTDILGDEENDFNGHSVSLSSDGSTVAIGAPGNDANGLYNSGQVRIFKFK